MYGPKTARNSDNATMMQPIRNSGSLRSRSRNLKPAVRVQHRDVDVLVDLFGNNGTCRWRIG